MVCLFFLQVLEMAALKMYCSSAVVGTSNLGTSVTNSGEFVGLKMMPSLKASSFTTRSMPVYAAPLTHLAKWATFPKLLFQSYTAINMLWLSINPWRIKMFFYRRSCGDFLYICNDFWWYKFWPHFSPYDQSTLGSLGVKRRTNDILIADNLRLFADVGILFQPRRRHFCMTCMTNKSRARGMTIFAAQWPCWSLWSRVASVASPATQRYYSLHWGKKFCICFSTRLQETSSTSSLKNFMIPKM